MIGFVIAAAVAAGGTALWYATRDEPPRSGSQLAPVGYRSFTELEGATDATLVVRVMTAPRRFVDFGADGQPDAPGDPGVPVELVDAEVTQVLRGDPALDGERITLSQPVPGSGDAGTAQVAADRMQRGAAYLVVARLVTPNPGVGDGGDVWVPAGSGQGVYDVRPDGAVTPRAPGVFRELFGPEGERRVTVAQLDARA